MRIVANEKFPTTSPNGNPFRNEPEREDDRGPAEDVKEELPAVLTPVLPLLEGERHGDADDPEKEREYPVRERPAVPPRMLELRVDVVPGAGIVDEDHAGNRGAAKGVQ